MGGPSELGVQDGQANEDCWALGHGESSRHAAGQLGARSGALHRIPRCGPGDDGFSGGTTPTDDAQRKQPARTRTGSRDPGMGEWVVQAARTRSSPSPGRRPPTAASHASPASPATTPSAGSSEDPPSADRAYLTARRACEPALRQVLATSPPASAWHRGARRERSSRGGGRRGAEIGRGTTSPRSPRGRRRAGPYSVATLT